MHECDNGKRSSSSSAGLNSRSKLSSSSSNKAKGVNSNNSTRDEQLAAAQRRKEEKKKLRRLKEQQQLINDEQDKMEIDVDGPVSPQLSTRKQPSTPSKQSKQSAREVNQVHTLQGHTSEVFACQWNPVKPGIIASGAGDSTARIWTVGETDQDSTSHTLQHYSQPDQTVRDITSISWNPTGTMLATGSFTGDANLWTVDGKLKQEFKKHSGPIFALRWNKTGTRLLSAGADKSAIVWDPFGTTEQRFLYHTEPILDVDWRDADTFATCSNDTFVIVSQIGEAGYMHKLRGHSNAVNTIRWNKDGTLLASCSDDQTAKIWSLSTPDGCVMELSEHSKEIYTLAWSPASISSPLATASFDHTVKLWDPALGTCLHTLQRHSEAVYSCVFTPDGRYIATGAFDGKVNIWNVNDGTLVKSWKSGGGVFEVSWAPSGDRLGVCSADTNVSVLDIRF